MPELPEVETIVRTLSPHVLGRTITGAHLYLPRSLHPLSLPVDSLRGCRISGAGRRGKLVMLELEPPRRDAASPERLLAHLRMTGRLLVKDAGVNAHTRCVFDLHAPSGEDSRLFFDDIRTFGQLFVANSRNLARWRFWTELGPEPLEMKADDLARATNSRAAVKACLLDQKRIAGIGNIYADEALFLAGINPVRPGNSLSRDEVKALMKSLRDVLMLAIRKCGSSIRDYRDADGNAGAFQKNFMAYGRGGQPCRKCGSTMQKCRVAGRGTVFCPACQS